MVRPVRTVAAPKVISDLVKWEADPAYCRESGVLAPNNPLTIGTPIGRIVSGAVTAAAKAGGNTGNGAITINATPRTAGAKIGVYRAICIAAAVNSGTFRVEDPDGFVLGDVAVGTLFSDDIRFTIADGATDFIVGDAFDITVAAGSGKLTTLNPAANDGSEICVGFSLVERETSVADDDVTYVRRMAMLASSGVAWPAGFTDAQKAKALADVETVGLIVRASI